MRGKSEPNLMKTLAKDNRLKIDPVEATKKLDKLVDIDLNNILYPLSQAQ